MNINKGLKILYFTAPWCSDCNFIKPFMPFIIDNHPEFEFIEIDRDDNSDLADKLSIFGIPSFIALKDGKEIGRLVNKNRKTREEINSFIDGLKI